MHQLSELYTKVSRNAINLKIVVFIRFCMVDKLNGQGLAVSHTEPYKNWNFQNDGVSRYFGGWLWQLVHLLILFCSFHWCVLCLCLIKTLVEHLYCDKDLFTALNWQRCSCPNHFSETILVKLWTKKGFMLCLVKVHPLVVCGTVDRFSVIKVSTKQNKTNQLTRFTD